MIGNSTLVGREMSPRSASSLCVIVFLILFPLGSVLFCQQVSRPSKEYIVKSMGFPKIWKPYLGSTFVWDRRGIDGEVAGEINVGAYKDLISPVIGAVGIAGEGYVRAGGSRVDGGARLLGVSRIFFVQGGVDYSVRERNADFLMSFMLPVCRGGPLGRGGNLRIDWFPGRNHSLSVGLSIPVGQPFMGKTRPALDHVQLTASSCQSESEYIPEPDLQETLERVWHAADWINRLTTPFLDQSTRKGKSEIAAFKEKIAQFKTHIQLKDDLYPGGHTFEAEVNVYHQELERAFSLAVRAGQNDDSELSGAQISAKARETLLDEVIIPYNRLLGQRKSRDSVRGFGCTAVEKFESWVTSSFDISPENLAGVVYIFRSLVKCIDKNRSASKHIWEDSRLVWIPMHYALRFEDHDTEDELDAIIEKAVNEKFTNANDVHYVINELFEPELIRTIHVAQDYHVLWIHDFSGRNKAGDPDAISYEVAGTYIQALTGSVEKYEANRKIPTYMIFLDQQYFQENHSRLWLELLQDPLGHELHLPREYEVWKDSIGRLQQDLRTAVAKSAALQSEVKAKGQQWLTNLIRVHVSITNPSDLSFRSGGFFKHISFAPDNIMRDHRKITFYDITELDPGRGEAMFTGMGIGEHYVGPTWDDRSILARGPALVGLKNAARELLLSQGISEIPLPLRPLPVPDNYDDMCEQLRAKGWTATAMQVHNATGFGIKYADVIKAILYNLMPNGSHLYIPDSLWNSPFWGAMLTGAALRGCIVLVVSPALENAPSPGNPQMSRANELFTRFVIIQSEMQEEIRSAGGLFKVGIYNMDVDVGDVVGKLQILINGIGQSEEFQEIFPFDSSVVQTVGTMPEVLESLGFEPGYRSDDARKRKPKLHLKSQFFASRRAIDTIVPMQGWDNLVRRYILARAEQVRRREDGVDVKDLRRELFEEVTTLIESWGKDLSAQERGEAILYLTVGSQNQDYRSMIMDGEALFVVGRTWAMVAYLDFVSLMAQTTWIDDMQQLDELLPRHRGFSKWLGRYLKLAL